MAPPTKLTPELQQKICEFVKAGSYPEASIVAAGVSPRTARRWLERGDKARSGPYHDLVLAMARAHAIAKVAKVAVVSKAANAGDWRASAWWLERTDPEHYGRHDQLDVKGEVRHEGGIEFRPYDKMIIPIEEPDPTATKRLTDVTTDSPSSDKDTGSKA